MVYFLKMITYPIMSSIQRSTVLLWNTFNLFRVRLIKPLWDQRIHLISSVIFIVQFLVISYKIFFYQLFVQISGSSRIIQYHVKTVIKQAKVSGCIAREEEKIIQSCDNIILLLPNDPPTKGSEHKQKKERTT